MGKRKRGERGEKASAVKKGKGQKDKDSRGRKGKKGEMTDRSGETKAKSSFGRRAAKGGGVPRKSLAGVLVALLCALCFSVPLSGQALRVDTALVRMARGEVQEYVIPQMASLEQPGIVRSGYRTVYPSGWTLGKASLSDGEGLINFFVIRLQGPVQKAQILSTTKRPIGASPRGTTGSTWVRSISAPGREKRRYGSRLIARERKAESTCGSILFVCLRD